MVFPDPISTANLYAEGHLDAAFVEVAGTALDRLREVDPRAFVWTMRYAKRGEHLKLRVHGPASLADAAGTTLAEIAEDWLSSLPPADPEAPRKSLPYAAPIDEEDAIEEDAPDRAFVSTRYSRHPVSLGARFEDDAHVARLVESFGAAAAFVLQAARAEDGRLEHREKQRLYLRLLTVGLAGLDSLDSRLDYLAYHRDWILRSRLRHAGIERVEKGEAFLGRFDTVAASLGEGLDRLRESADLFWGFGDSAGAGPAEIAFHASVARLLDELPDTGPRADPFAGDPRFPVLFKVFHGLANQLGLDRLNEALPHHLLCRAVASEVPPLRFVPPPLLSTESSPS